MRSTAPWWIVVLAMTGCLRTTQYRCESSSACGVGGVCEAEGFCSVPDGACASGRRFGDAAGALAGQCVGETTPELDGGPELVDAIATDANATVDAPPGPGCPAGYDPLPGAPGHLYRRLTTTEAWATQQAACAATSSSAYLAVPDDLAELQALATLSGVARFWVGINDLVTEGTFVTVLGAPATFLPWEPGAPNDGGGGEDCVEAISATAQLNDQRCNTKLAAICECAP
jgi:hypothetical protein